MCSISALLYIENNEESCHCTGYNNNVLYICCKMKPKRIHLHARRIAKHIYLYTSISRRRSRPQIKTQLTMLAGDNGKGCGGVVAPFTDARVRVWLSFGQTTSNLPPHAATNQIHSSARRIIYLFMSIIAVPRIDSWIQILYAHYRSLIFYYILLHLIIYDHTLFVMISNYH